METRRRTWMLVYGFMELLCVGSSPLSVVLTRSGVGMEAVLPCKWDSLKEAPSAAPYIQWQTQRDMVFERMGSSQFQAEAYQNRADVPEGMLAKGNCSLHLSDIQFSDAKIYDSYLVVGKTGSKRRIFIQSVQLFVLDHKSYESVERGSDLTLDLYTLQAGMVMFQNMDNAEWNVLWQRSGSGEDLRQQVEERNRKLVVRNVTAADEGVYKVMDAEGLALSTVKVSVKEPLPPTERNMMENRISLESSVGVICPSLPLSLLLILVLYLL